MDSTKPSKKRKQRLYMSCPDCNSFDIIHDYIHAEYYCNNCGLIVSTNNTVRRFTIAEFKAKPKLFNDKEKLEHILDIMIFSLNIKKFC